MAKFAQNDSSCFNDYFTRLATFRNLIPAHVRIPTFHLAKGGFYLYNGASLIKCFGCQREVDISNITFDPSDKTFHRDKCLFISTLASHARDGFDEVSDLETDGCSDFKHGTQSSRGAYQHLSLADLPNVRYSEEKSYNQPENLFGHDRGTGSVKDPSIFHLPNSETCSSTDPQANQVFQVGASNKAEISIGKSNYSYNDLQEYTTKNTLTIFYHSFSLYPEENCFYDFGISRSECSSLDRNSDITPVHALNCEKNPGHYSYFPVHSVRPEQVPSSVRDTWTIKFLQVFSVLMVRVISDFTSKNRPKEACLTESLFSGKRFGSGFMFDEPIEDVNDERSIKRFVPFIGKRKRYLIFIRTNRHLIFDQSEAEKTSVEFSFSPSNSSRTTILRGEKILFSNVSADNTVILVCSSSDRDFIQRLIETRLEVLDLAEKLPLKAKESMTKKVFIIHHPHGSDKVLSYGDSVMVKYVIENSEGNGRKKLTKIGRQSNIESHISQNTVRKSLLYAADSCPGSSGAPVITFQRKISPDGSLKYDLDIWIHNGVDLSNNLGASVLKAYTQEDFESSSGSPESTSTDQNHDSDDDDPIKNQEVTSPVFKVLTLPSYPVYIAYQKRLESFVAWPYNNIHEPESLALAGFFYAGYADCVRCFQCGLGLRSWKPGDNIDDQHKKHRPNCPFLLAHTKVGINNEATNASLPNYSEEKLAITLLKKENEKLESQLKCKVCFKSQIKDLFLPCGDLFACTECSKLLTHCPSCNKQILATVTTYFI